MLFLPSVHSHALLVGDIISLHGGMGPYMVESVLIKGVSLYLGVIVGYHTSADLVFHYPVQVKI